MAFGFVGLDDRDFILDDRAFLARPVDMLRAFRRSYMHVVDPAHPYQRPLVTASYVLDAQWTGTRPVGYHFTNVLLHVVASVLCLELLRRLEFGLLVAVLGGLTFAVHPALVSAVAWIPGRNDSLLAVIALSAWLAFIAYVEGASRRARTIHLALFALALFAKETALMLPLVCCAHLAIRGFGSPRGASFRALLALVPGWAACVTLRLLGRPFGAGAQVTLADVASHSRLLLSGLGQLVFPFAPSLVGVVSDSPVGGGILAAALFAALTVLSRRARPRVVLLGAAAFALWSLPSLVVPGTLVLGSRLYLPAVGVVIGAAELTRALTLEPRVLGAFGAAAISAFAVAAAAYAETFRNPRSFARAAVDAAPRSPVAHVCMGSVEQRDGDDDGALAEYKLALSLGATYVVRNNLAVLDIAHGRWVDAERELRQELDVDPGYALAYRNLAIVLRHEGRTQEARAADVRADELGGEDDRGTTGR